MNILQVKNDKGEWRGIPAIQGPPGPQGPAGQDGTPIGTIISYMGLTAPKDYLICDGTEYSIADYPELAKFFQTQFGSEAYFGGDGTTTFAVPDMRNLFLRGFHGESVDQLSGDIGVKQEGTGHPGLYTGLQQSGRLVIGGTAKAQGVTNRATNFDTANIAAYIGASIVATAGNESNYPFSYTSRPVNMAVLYCIKAAEEEPYENICSVEETVVGRWIDGKPIYRKGFLFENIVVAPYTSADLFYPDSDFEKAINIYGHAYNEDAHQILNSFYATVYYVIAERKFVFMNNAASTFTRIEFALEYTKTTD